MQNHLQLAPPLNMGCGICWVPQFAHSLQSLLPQALPGNEVRVWERVVSHEDSPACAEGCQQATIRPVDARHLGQDRLWLIWCGAMPPKAGSKAMNVCLGPV